MHKQIPRRVTARDRRISADAGILATKWFALHGRAFPWRSPVATEYEKVISEILLQRTTAATVSSIYRPFFTRFPTWKSLTLAEPAEIESFLKPIGLWKRRSRALRSLAEEMLNLQGRFPESRQALESLTGVGQYVANAVRLFRYGQPEPLLDVNMARVLERCVRPRQLADIRHDRWLQRISRIAVNTCNPVLTNWAILDIGAIYCRPSGPLCAECPLHSICTSFQKSRNRTPNSVGRM